MQTAVAAIIIATAFWPSTTNNLEIGRIGRVE